MTVRFWSAWACQQQSYVRYLSSALVNNEVSLCFNQLMRDVSTHSSASSTLGSASWTGCCCGAAGRGTLVVTLSSRQIQRSDQLISALAAGMLNVLDKRRWLQQQLAYLQESVSQLVSSTFTTSTNTTVCPAGRGKSLLILLSIINTYEIWRSTFHILIKFPNRELGMSMLQCWNYLMVIQLSQSQQMCRYFCWAEIDDLYLF